MTVQCARDARAVDLMLPRHARLGLLVADIVGMVVDEEPGTHGWRVDRLDGVRCDESVSLHDSGVRDGDVIVLAPQSAVSPGPLHDDVFRALTQPVDGPPVGPLPAAGWTAAGMVAVAALILSGLFGGQTLLAAMIAVGAALGCLTVSMRTGHSSATCLFIGFGCAAAVLVVPGPPGQPHLLLTAAVGGTAAVVSARIAGADTRLCAALATCGASLAVVTAAASALSVDIAGQGAATAVVALGVLGASGRVALGLGKIRPRRGAAPGVVVRGRHLLAGLVTGSAVAAAAGLAMVAAGCLHGRVPWSPAALFGGIVSAILLLRMRLHVDPRCRGALGWCGLAGVAATLVPVLESAPRHAGWLAVAVFAAAVWCHVRGSATDPVLARTIEIVEYGLLAAVVPLACWVGGGYDVVRSASLV
ncbi:type VII secretion integral membrane protein EccD [Mycobacterium sp. NPDC003323]